MKLFISISSFVFFYVKLQKRLALVETFAKVYYWPECPSQLIRGNFAVEKCYYFPDNLRVLHNLTAQSVLLVKLNGTKNR